ncbi:MAG: cysteine desulfurase family protein [Tepidisphaeraceae bacterium]
MDVLYLDNNATTKVAPEALAAMMPYLSELYGNPSSVHRFGQRARHAIDNARSQIAALVGCSDSELLFTGGGTESINTAVRGILAARAPLKKIVTSTVEHSATRELCHQLAKEGTEVVEIPVDSQGSLDLGQLRAAVDEQTALVTMMWANNETGVLFDVPEIAAVCRTHRIPFHCDATQAVGKTPVNLSEIGCDAGSFSAHKFHGPKGVGSLYLRRGTRMRPLLIGGPQERGRRGGTENLAGIVGMGAAAELAARPLAQMHRVAATRDRFEQRVVATIPDAHILAARAPRVPNTTNIGFARLEAEAILLLLSEQGICASAGAACSSGSLEPSHVLRAMQIDQTIAHGAIRFSLSRYTTESEIDRVLEVLPGVIERLRTVLPVARAG